MAYGLQITRYAVENVDWIRYGTYRMRVEVTAAADDVDPNIFVYQRSPAGPYEDEACDRFVAIAGPAQIADIPIAEPDTEVYGSFFRLSWVELDFTAESLAEEVWDIIKAEAAILCQSMTRYSRMAAIEDVFISATDDGTDEAYVSETIFM